MSPLQMPPEAWALPTRFPEANHASESCRHFRRKPMRNAPLRQKKNQKKNQREKTRKKKEARVKPRLDHSKPDELESFHDVRHSLLSNSMVMFGMRLGVDLQSFVESVDPIKNFRTLAALSSGNFISSKAKRKERKRNARVALIAAANLQGGASSVDCCVKVKSSSIESPEESSQDIASRIRQKSIYFSNEDNLPIVIDSGASLSLTPVLEDFIGDLKPAHIKDLNGLSSKISVVGVGTVRWTICDLFGVVRSIETTAYYVPQATIRLFSPQSYFQENDAGKCVITAKKSVLTLADDTELEFPHNPGSNLPFMLLAERYKGFVGVTYEDAVALGDQCALDGLFLSVADETNQNLSSSSRELLLWHWCLGHANMQWVQRLASQPQDTRDGQKPILARKNKNVSCCPPPLCAACQLAKQHRRPVQTTKTTPLPDKHMHLRANDILPGDCVSIDQYMSSLPGRLAHTFGKEKKKDRYCGGTLFVDHASGLVHLRHQESLRVGETLVSKRNSSKWPRRPV